MAARIRSPSTWRGFLPGLLLLGVLLPRRAPAAACCMSATAYGVGRLKIWEQAAAGTSLSYLHGVATWAGDGVYRPYGSGVTLDDVRAETWAMWRLHRRGAAWVRVPVNLGVRAGKGRDGQLATTALAPGDLSLGVRWEWIGLGEWVGVPAVSSVLGLTAPTGRGPADSADPLGADISGRGAFALVLATAVERTHLPWFARATAGLAVPMPMWRERLGVWQRYGPSVSLALATGRELRDGLVLTALVRGLWEAPIATGGRTVAGSDARLLTGSLAVSWRMTSDWTLQASAGGAPPLGLVGKNREAQVTASLAVRYGYTP